MTDRVVVADAVVVGGGVAGLSAALGLSGDVVLVSKSPFGVGGSTEWAQGGVAVALGAGDSAAAHAADTTAVGVGLNDHEAVAVLTAEGPARVRELMLLGARFDRGPDGELIFGREAGHRTNRIVHANGDATGAEILRALTSAVAARENVIVHDHTFAVDLVVDGDRVIGLHAVGPSGEAILYSAPAVVLATGGIGQVYARTTNPAEVTGDGLAMAARAGAQLIDLEFVQFHPTALATDRDPMPLLTEALRGAGALLIDSSGKRFMVDIHPDAELAPRDVVARATWQRVQHGETVYLDATQAIGDALPEKFPTVFSFCREAGIDPRATPIPASPAAHYHMGGVETDTYGRTSVAGLWAVGEVASTGVHGANRLASNSLLEGLVYGARAAASVAASELPAPSVKHGSRPEPVIVSPETVRLIRDIMWEQVGVMRHEEALAAAIGRLQSIEGELGRAAGEAANMALVARLVAIAARDRRESRGAHYRLDYPDAGPVRRLTYAGSTLAGVA